MGHFFLPMFLYKLFSHVFTNFGITFSIGKPLTNMTVMTIGKLSKNKDDVKAIIEELGGKTTGSANKATVCVSTQSKYLHGFFFCLFVCLLCLSSANCPWKTDCWLTVCQHCSLTVHVYD